VAAALERASEHPLAAAFLAAAYERSIDVPAPRDFRAVPGMGVEGVVDGEPYLLGNEALVADASGPTAVGAQAEALRLQGQTAMYLAGHGRLLALFGFADPVKASTADAIRALRAEGLRVMMLTGDNVTTARAVASTLELDEVRAGVMPGEKREVVRRFQSEGFTVAMAGDGINDAPALAEAAVGIAMGTGTDIAMESAGITLVKGDLRGLIRARRLSRATMRNIRQNLWLAFLYNAIGVPVAAGVLYPHFGTLISPIWASAAMTFSSVSVILNALRLRRLPL
jgi:Cu+-exporting ATPase